MIERSGWARASERAAQRAQHGESIEQRQGELFGLSDKSVLGRGESAAMKSFDLTSYHYHLTNLSTADIFTPRSTLAVFQVPPNLLLPSFLRIQGRG